MSRGILLVNLGTPNSHEVADVRSYLNQFLMDPYVLDVPWVLRRLIVSCFILPFRPPRSAAAYASIWEPEGSPLLLHSRALETSIASHFPIPCAVAMRYGEPSIENTLNQLHDQGVRELLLVPLYPQHAQSTRTTSIEAVQRLLPNDMSVRVFAPFFDRPGYIHSLAASIEEHLTCQWDHLLLSYHGLPERHITRSDPTGNHCLQRDDCCSTPSPAHDGCYRHQSYRTSELLAARLQIPNERYSVSFQSRLGRLPWLTPYTDDVLRKLPGQGIKRLVVACPAFVVDNLETLEEIGIRGRETFLAAGGTELTLVPCLNDNGDWVKTLAHWCRETFAESQNRTAEKA
ncbi:MAG: ferrochelatase [Gammaproteobacteria bacterium]|nr:ferrochelatase [Gammaproteobacteria bacterium]